MFGEWRTEPATYAAEVRRYSEEIGQLDWAAPQDWMCEPSIREKTGLSVADHQARTIDSIFALRALDADLRWVPVLQGWTVDDYLRHADAYGARGLDLAAEEVVGVGSVASRQGRLEIAELAWRLADAGLKTHFFGVKTRGLATIGPYATSADSMAWSYRARRAQPLPGCKHKSCSNCLIFALAWRERILGRAVWQTPVLAI